MDTQSINDATKKTILDTFTSLDDGAKAIPFCVDGRDGDVANLPDSNMHLFAQSLGGSLGIAAIQFMNQGSGDFSATLLQALQTLKSRGFQLGVHRDGHAHDDASGCGFADNLQKILSRFANQEDVIAKIIEQSAPGVLDSNLYSKVVSDARDAASHHLPAGETIIQSSLDAGAYLQILEGNHEEVAAVVNLQESTTLDTKSLVDSGIQAFNLDVWYVLEQTKALDIDEAYALHAVLGLYVATEMVLVEDKKNVRLPIIVRQ